jgi:hypothetical protein
MNLPPLPAGVRVDWQDVLVDPANGRLTMTNTGSLTVR